LECILDIPLEEALWQLPLTDDIVPAILDKQGIPGEALACVVNYELWHLPGMRFKSLDPSVISDAYLKSINWAKDVLSNLG